MTSKQKRIAKLLSSKYGFVFSRTINGATGPRIVMLRFDGLEASVSQYRVCFYSSSAAPAMEGATKGFPARSQPRCFDADKKTLITEYLEKLFAVYQSAV